MSKLNLSGSVQG